MSLVPPPEYLLGRHQTGVLIAGVSISAGAYVASTTIAGNLHVAGTLDSCRFEESNESEPINPMDIYFENNVSVLGCFTGSLGEIRVRNVLPVISAIQHGGFGLVRLQYNFDATNCWACIARIAGYPVNTARGKNWVEMTVDTAGQPAYEGEIAGLIF